MATPSRASSPSRHSDGTNRYGPDTSIVLVGIRGTGTSTLAVMVASTLGYRLIDSDQYFHQQTGLSRAAYKTAHGLKKYRHIELRHLRAMLDENKTRSIIVCGPGAVAGTGRVWLSTYSKSHPVIHILREAEEIRKYLALPDTDFVPRLLRLSSPIHRSISSFEFFNVCGLPVPKSPSDEPSTVESQSPKSLALKQVERDFIQLINNATGKTAKPDNHHHRGGYNSSLPPLESRCYTHALTLTVSALEQGQDQLRNIETTADALELIFPVVDLHQHSRAATVDQSILDYISHRFYLARRIFQIPIIVNLSLNPKSLQAENGRQRQKAYLPNKLYFEFLHHILRLAPDYLCVDITSTEPHLIKNLVASKGSTRLLADLFNPHAGPDAWDSQDLWDTLHTAGAFGFDMMRLRQRATCAADNTSLETFINKHAAQNEPNTLIPIIAYNTGPLGRPSYRINKILNPITTPFLRTLSRSSLPTLKEAQQSLHSSLPLFSPSAPMPAPLPTLSFGVYGNHKCLHSLSPAMYSAAFSSTGLPHTYTIYAHDTLTPFLADLIGSPAFGGLSITAPFKTDIISLSIPTSPQGKQTATIELTPQARAIGAVNTLVRKKGQQQLLGDNTDWIGIASCITRNLSPINAVKRRTTALVLGAGGMARAAVYALVVHMGVGKVFIRNRTKEKGKELAKGLSQKLFNDSNSGEGTGIRVLEWGEAGGREPGEKREHLEEEMWPKGFDLPTIIVSCIPCEENNNGGDAEGERRYGRGMVNNRIPVGWLGSPTGGVAVELAYTPRDTPFVRQFRAMADAGWITVDGLQVLPEQGSVQFELFTGRRAPKKLMQREVMAAYEKTKKGDSTSELSSS